MRRAMPLRLVSAGASAMWRKIDSTMTTEASTMIPKSIAPNESRFAGIPVLQINHPGIVQRVLRRRPLALITALATRILEAGLGWVMCAPSLSHP